MGGSVFGPNGVRVGKSNLAITKGLMSWDPQKFNRGKMNPIYILF